MERDDSAMELDSEHDANGSREAGSDSSDVSSDSSAEPPPVRVPAVVRANLTSLLESAYEGVVREEALIFSDRVADALRTIDAHHGMFYGDYTQEVVPAADEFLPVLGAAGLFPRQPEAADNELRYAEGRVVVALGETLGADYRGDRAAPLQARDSAFAYFDALATDQEGDRNVSGVLGRHALAHLGTLIVTQLRLRDAPEQHGALQLILSLITHEMLVSNPLHRLKLWDVDLTQFMAADARYGFEAAGSVAITPDAQSVLATVRAGRRHTVVDMDAPVALCWSTPSLRAVHRLMLAEGVERPPRALPEGVRFAMHPFFNLLRRAERWVGIYTLPGKTREVALADKSEVDGVLSYTIKAIALGEDADADAPELQGVFSPFQKLRLRLCRPRALRSLGYLATDADMATIESADFQAPLRRLAPVRDARPGEVPNYVLVVSDVTPAEQEARPGDTAGAADGRALNYLRILAAFFADLARELGLPVLLDFSNRPPSVRDAVALDSTPERTPPRFFLWRADVMGNGPVPRFVQSQQDGDHFWFYPEAKPRVLQIPDSLFALPDARAFDALGAGAVGACVGPAATPPPRESIPAPLLALETIMGERDREDGRPPKRARLQGRLSVTCTECGAGGAALIRADGLHAFCDLHCQARFAAPYF